MVIRFIALCDFWSDELQSGYSAGLSYTMAPDDEALGSLLEGWLDEGKVQILDESIAISMVAGTGSVE